MTDTRDDPIVPGPATPLERGAAAMETTPEQWRKGAEELSGPLPQRPGEGWCAVREPEHDGSYLHHRNDRCEGFRTTP